MAAVEAAAAVVAAHAPAAPPLAAAADAFTPTALAATSAGKHDQVPVLVPPMVATMPVVRECLIPLEDAHPAAVSSRSSYLSPLSPSSLVSGSTDPSMRTPSEARITTSIEAGIGPST